MSNPNTETKEAMIERIVAENNELKRKNGDLEWSRDLYAADAADLRKRLEAEVKAHNMTLELSIAGLAAASEKIHGLKSKLAAADAYVLSLLQK